MLELQDPSNHFSHECRVPDEGEVMNWWQLYFAAVGFLAHVMLVGGLIGRALAKRHLRRNSNG